MPSLADRLTLLSSPRVLILGDPILDRYVVGSAERVSPEAPVVVLKVGWSEVRLGGAASVALLLQELGAEPVLVGAVGADPNGTLVQKMLSESGIHHDGLIPVASRMTTVKERVMGGRSGTGVAGTHQLLRVDYEMCSELDEDDERRLIAVALDELPSCRAVLVSDYAKGVCTQRVVRSVIEAARRGGIPVLVDPARGSGFDKYEGADVLVPNRLEAELACGRKIRSEAEAASVGHELMTRFSPNAIALKLDCDGITLFEQNYPTAHFPAQRREACDVTGAGDMVLAMLGLCLAGGMELRLAIPLANIAAGLEVQRVGVAPISREEIHAEILRIEAVDKPLVCNLDQICERVKEYQRSGKSVVLTNGCFDLLHVGHVQYLQQAARLGDVLIVAINSDASIRRIKGPRRPVIGEVDRAALVAALGCVDHVLIFQEDTPCEILRRIRPDILVKGGTYTTGEVVGKEVVEAYGGQVCVVGSVDGVSTTRILQKVTSLLGASDE